jgi:hypothetical protein
MSTTRTYQYGGTLDPDRHYYVPRKADTQLLQLCLRSEYAYIFNARQTGKSSLIERTRRVLVDEQNVRAAYFSLEAIGTIPESDMWFSSVLSEISREFSLDAQAQSWWGTHEQYPTGRRWMMFFEEVVLSEISDSVVVFIDEIDKTIHLPFRDDFFSALRLTYNERARRPKLRSLSFVLAGMTSPQELIGDSGRTSYNIGEAVELGDLTERGADVKVLADGLGMSTQKRRQRALGWVLNWTGGHPYLTQKICSLVAEQKWEKCTAKDINRLVKDEFLHGEMHDSNLNEVERALTEQRKAVFPRKDVLREFERVLDGRRRDMNSIAQVELKLTGVVKVERGQLQVRNRIYRDVFDRRWLRRYYRPPLHEWWRTLSPQRKFWLFLRLFILMILCIAIIYLVLQFPHVLDLLRSQNWIPGQ